MACACGIVHGHFLFGICAFMLFVNRHGMAGLGTCIQNGKHLLGWFGMGQAWVSGPLAGLPLPPAVPAFCILHSLLPGA